MSNDVTFTGEQVKFMMAAGLTQKANPHGPGGLFQGGIRPGMPSAIERPSNLAGILPIRPARDANADYDILTGQQGVSGSAATDACSTFPTAGNLLKCTTRVPFGKFALATSEIDASDANLRRDVSDLDRNLLNSYVTPENPFVPTMPNGTLNINHIVGKKWMEFGHQAAIAHSKAHIVGNSAASTLTEFITEYNGLDRLIKTGHTDVNTDTLCPAADSVVATSNGTLDGTVMLQLINVIRTLKQRAENVGAPGIPLALVVNPNMKYDLFNVWACNYATTDCANTVGRFDLMSSREMFDRMMTGSYVLVDGEQIPVQFDFGVPFTENPSVAGEYTSDIFVIPLGNIGGEPTLSFEYLPYTDSPMPGMVSDMPGITDVFDAKLRGFNNGLYLAAQTNGDFCQSTKFISRGRLVLLTPFLAGRLDDVVWTPGVTQRGPEFAGGGETAIA